MKGSCQCSDPLCPVHAGNADLHGNPACFNPATTVLYRVDMDDETGTSMCSGCAEDAMESGIFTDEQEEDEQEEDEQTDWEYSAQFMEEFDPSKAGRGLGEYEDEAEEK